MFYYKKNIGDYYKKTGRLSMLEHGAYTLLLDSCYDRERFPTLEDALDWTWARTTEEIDAVKFVLEKFFEFDGEFYVQSRIQDELNAYHKMAETNSRIAKDREASRRLKKQSVNEPSTKREPIVNEPPPNQEPRTKNQEPLTIIKDITLDKPKKNSVVKKLIPSDFGISDGVRKWAIENNHHNLEKHLEGFIDYANSGAKKYADWDSAFKRAIREDWFKVNKPVYQNNYQQPQNTRMQEIEELSKQWELKNESNYQPY